jgi:hypothetical protein
MDRIKAIQDVVTSGLQAAQKEPAWRPSPLLRIGDPLLLCGSPHGTRSFPRQDANLKTLAQRSLV